ncbi:hypothetical protein VIGAN_02112100 [Vigna angularis var. angularis]|uniref:Uncharacterized protein n=1 Tax=Vigna angularis var. angularis TaxID=157739 RepID=A0A0S3RD75_PHAAN|nr:hypothetical protein VIGAN_02112100 [Vigna angularis var. angularis]
MQRLRLRAQLVRADFAVDLLAVKIAVAITGRANYGLQRAVLSCGQELAAAIDGVTADADGMILLTFSVSARPRGAAFATGVNGGRNSLSCAHFRPGRRVSEGIVNRRRH